MILRCAVAVVLMTLAGPAFAAEIGCKAPFTSDATLADIQKAFGKANVKTGKVDGPEGTTMIATTVFPKDPRKKFEIYWYDEEHRSGLAGWTLAADDTGPFGVKLGMSVADVEKINGAPFNIMGFYWDYGGGAGFETGKLAKLPGDCELSLTFDPTVENVSDKISAAISGDQQLSSDMPELKMIKPVVGEVRFGYADENEGTDESGESD
jgi:hypothetical protein